MREQHAKNRCKTLEDHLYQAQQRMDKLHEEYEQAIQLNYQRKVHLEAEIDKLQANDLQRKNQAEQVTKHPGLIVEQQESMIMELTLQQEELKQQVFEQLKDVRERETQQQQENKSKNVVMLQALVLKQSTILSTQVAMASHIEELRELEQELNMSYTFLMQQNMYTEATEDKLKEIKENTRQMEEILQRKEYALYETKQRITQLEVEVKQGVQREMLLEEDVSRQHAINEEHIQELSELKSELHKQIGLTREKLSKAQSVENVLDEVFGQKRQLEQQIESREKAWDRKLQDFDSLRFELPEIALALTKEVEDMHEMHYTLTTDRHALQVQQEALQVAERALESEKQALQLKTAALSKIQEELQLQTKAAKEQVNFLKSPLRFL